MKYKYTKLVQVISERDYLYNSHIPNTDTHKRQEFEIEGSAVELLTFINEKFDDIEGVHIDSEEILLKRLEELGEKELVEKYRKYSENYWYA